jgi:hypothetical protein
MDIKVYMFTKGEVEYAMGHRRGHSLGGGEVRGRLPCIRNI